MATDRDGVHEERPAAASYIEKSAQPRNHPHASAPTTLVARPASFSQQRPTAGRVFIAPLNAVNRSFVVSSSALRCVGLRPPPPRGCHSTAKILLAAGGRPVLDIEPLREHAVPWQHECWQAADESSIILSGLYPENGTPERTRSFRTRRGRSALAWLHIVCLAELCRRHRAGTLLVAGNWCRIPHFPQDRRKQCLPEVRSKTLRLPEVRSNLIRPFHRTTRLRAILLSPASSGCMHVTRRTAAGGSTFARITASVQLSSCIVSHSILKRREMG